MNEENIYLKDMWFLNEFLENGHNIVSLVLMKCNEI